MKKLIIKTLSITMAIVFILLTLMSCDPTTDPGEQNNGSNSSGKQNNGSNNINEYPPIEILKNDSELVLSLIEFLNWLDNKIAYDMPAVTLEDQINRIKGGHLTQPLLVDFQPGNCYFVCGYYNCDEDQPDKGDYYCASKYTWVKYESVTDIRDNYNDKAFIVAFQINRPSITQNILTGDDVSKSIETIGLYTPEFVNGTNVSTFKVVGRTFINLTTSESNIIYLHSYEPNEPNEIDCICLENEYYIFLEIYTVSDDGKRYDHDNSWHLGEYYDSMMEIMITGKYSKELSNGSVSHYGLFDIDKFVNEIIGE